MLNHMCLRCCTHVRVIYLSILFCSCPYLHRTTGDTERRYHLRYYKTGTCVHETDARGHCVKNGPHCAFAHGPHDLRQPVYDIREIIAQQDQPSVVTNTEIPTNGTGVAPPTPLTPDANKADKSVFLEDARWQGMSHNGDCIDVSSPGIFSYRIAIRDSKVLAAFHLEKLGAKV